MKVITLNANGIRASAKKGLMGWLASEQADVVCLQEVRAGQAILDKADYQLEGYHAFHAIAEKPGYSGVSIFTKHQPTQVVSHLDFALSDSEGRYLHVEFDNIIIASIYFPSGTSGDARQQEKYSFLDFMRPHLLSLSDQKPAIFCGDVNIAHTKADIKNWRGNQKNSGFLPEERAWLDELFEPEGLTDAFRVVDSREAQYTWWSNRGQAYANNTGWRIDYQLVSQHLADKVQSAEIYKTTRLSDHAPLIMTYDYELKASES